MAWDGDMSVSMPRALEGFRRRWDPPRGSVSDQSGPSDAAEHIQCELPADGAQEDDLFCGDTGEIVSVDVDVSLLHDADPQQDLHVTDGKLLFESVGEMQQPPPIQVLDPQNREPQWKHVAIEADAKRFRSSFQKLPREMEGSAFRPLDRWHSTGLAAFDKLFQPTFVGAFDVFDSQVVQTRLSVSVFRPDAPVVPISSKRARLEPLDEDIRQKALLRLGDLMLQDPLATQLGAWLRGQVEQGEMPDNVEQSIRDAFRMKTSSTLLECAASLWKLTGASRDMGQLHPLRLSEAQLYVVLCRMRESGAGATTAQHVLEALHLLDGAISFQLVDLTEVVSSRCRGVARDMYLTKDQLCQKVPLVVEQVRKLEMTMEKVGTVLRCTIGRILFCIHACCRWKDSQRLKAITTESGHGETLLYADVLTSDGGLDPLLALCCCRVRSLHGRLGRPLAGGEYNPGLPAVARVVRLADVAGDELQSGSSKGAEELNLSDSDSSVTHSSKGSKSNEMSSKLKRFAYLCSRHSRECQRQTFMCTTRQDWYTSSTKTTSCCAGGRPWQISAVHKGLKAGSPG